MCMFLAAWHVDFCSVLFSICMLCLIVLQLKRHVVTIDKYVDVQQNNEKQLLQAVAAQPVSVGICGSERAFQMYSKVGPCGNMAE